MTSPDLPIQTTGSHGERCEGETLSVQPILTVASEVRFEGSPGEEVPTVDSGLEYCHPLGITASLLEDPSGWSVRSYGKTELTKGVVSNLVRFYDARPNCVECFNEALQSFFQVQPCNKMTLWNKAKDIKKTLDKKFRALRYINC
jgi:hypothetical protein